MVKSLDNKPIHMATNFINRSEENIVQRWDKSQRKFIQVLQPQIVSLNNNSMGEIDLFDYLIEYYSTFIKYKQRVNVLWIY